MNLLTKIFLIISFITANVSSAMELHSTLETEIKPHKDGRVTIAFKVVPHKGMRINIDEATPWTVQLKDPKGITFDDTIYGKEAYAADLPGFRISGKPSTQSAWNVEYKVVSFICTADKSRCFRDIHKKKLVWTPSTKKVQSTKKPSSQKPK